MSSHLNGTHDCKAVNVGQINEDPLQNNKLINSILQQKKIRGQECLGGLS